MGKVETHKTAMDGHDGLVDLQVGRATAQALHIDTPPFRVEVEGLEGTPLAEGLDLVDVLVAAIVTSAGIALGVLVGHGRAKGVEDGARSHVLGSDEDDGLALALNLIFLIFFYVRSEYSTNREKGKREARTII